MATISTLKDSKTDEVCYPQTIIDAVFDTDGSPLRDILESAIPESVIQSIVAGTCSPTSSS